MPLRWNPTPSHVQSRLPSLSPLLPPARKRDTRGVLDRERHAEIKTVCVCRMRRIWPHNKPAATISRLRQHEPWTDVFQTCTNVHMFKCLLSYKHARESRWGLLFGGAPVRTPIQPQREWRTHPAPQASPPGPWTGACTDTDKQAAHKCLTDSLNTQTHLDAV